MGDAAEILDVDNPDLGYDADPCPYSNSTKDAGVFNARANDTNI
jgi:hypothetical protein